jgi:protein associated with RNAse G/E
MNPTLMVLHLLYSWGVPVMVISSGHKYYGRLEQVGSECYTLKSNHNLIIGANATIVIRPGNPQPEITLE